jgi:hypothetical protein
MTTASIAATVDATTLAAAADRAARMIPPAWPLAATVAVNPFLGQTAETLAEAGARLARVGGVPVTMPREWYAGRILTGAIADADLADALAACPHRDRPADVAALKALARQAAPAREALPTVADLAAAASGIDWPGLVADRIGAWAATQFDEGQALWTATGGRRAWTAWRAWAVHDLTPEIQGLSGFAAFVDGLPDDPAAALARSAGRLGLSAAALDTYLHALLLGLGGWAQYARHLQWKAELAGGADPTPTDLLAIRLAWEEALASTHSGAITERWAAVRRAHEAPVVPDADLIADAILQEAAERAGQRTLAATLGGPAEPAATERPALQAAFCIDVRSEVFRRALESVDPSVRTVGFAGFFGIFAKHRRFASDVEELRLPVLLNPTVASTACGHAHDNGHGHDHGPARSAPAPAPDADARYRARAVRAWGRFRQAAVSSFAFVEATGPMYAAKILRDALGLAPAAADADPMPRFAPALDADARIGAGEMVLRAMSMTSGFARVVLLAGHGANVVNNPHASGLHCGACGGYSGEVNARLLASLLNDPAVRAGLVGRGITVPEDTLFVGALHDTTTDAITLYDGDADASRHGADLARVRGWLASAGALARGERALRLPRARTAGDVPRRSRDWAEVRPEWALAGCRAFVAAPRTRTAGRSLEGRAFLHDYDWTQDAGRGFPVLELIMTAPVVVASWISLQYYGSTVAPAVFGSGNKLLHNVVGGIGVLEGNGGPMRAGLAWQSVHDGDGFVHDPVRLSVCIEAPLAAMTDILARHDGVRALFDRRWLHLFAMDADGRLVNRYVGDLRWEPAAAAPPLKAVA